MKPEFGNRQHVELKQKPLFEFLVESAGELGAEAIRAERTQFDALLSKMRRGEILTGPERKAYEALGRKFTSDAHREFGLIVKSYQEVANHFEKHVQTIKNWCKKGMPRRGRGAYDLKEIRRWAGAEGLLNEGSVEEDPEDGFGPGSGYGAKLQIEKYLHEKARREREQLKVKELSGELVSVQHVAREFRAMAQAIKMDLLALPHKLAPFLEQLDAPQIQKKLEEAVDGVLRHLSEGGQFGSGG